MFGKLLIPSKRGMANPTDVIVNVLVMIVLATALIPVIKTFIAGATNLTTTESTLLGLSTLLLIIGITVLIVRKTGISKS